jgi:hypothetical protein
MKLDHLRTKEECIKQYQVVQSTVGKASVMKVVSGGGGTGGGGGAKAAVTTPVATTTAAAAPVVAAVVVPSKVVGEEGGAGDGWSQEQQKQLEAGLVKFPASMEKNERWKCIAEGVEGKSKKEKVFTWDMFEGAREGAYEVLWETVFELTNDRLQTANRKGELRPLGYDRWEEGRKLQWKKKAKDALKRCMLMNGRMHAAMDAAEGTVVTDGNNEEDELPALQIKVLLKYLVEVCEEEGVYKCMDEALEAVEEGMEKEAFGEPWALTFVRQWHGKTCEEWEAWMAGDKRREKATLAGPTQFAVPDTDDEQDEADDKVRVRRFIHLTELACFQELVHRGLMTKKKAKAAIETMDRKGYNQEGIKQFILGMMYENCEKAASAEKKPHQRETNLYIVLGDQLFGNEGMDKAMARVDEPETFRAVPRLSILIQYLGVRFDRKVVKQCVDAAMWDLEDAMEEETFGPRQTRMKTMAMRAAALNGKGRRKEGAAKEREGARGGGRRGEAAAGGGRGAGGRGRREESGRKHAG